MKPSILLLKLCTLMLVVGLSLGTLSAFGFAEVARLNALYWALLLLLGGLAAVDARRLHALPSPTLSRTLAGHLSLSRWNEVQLTLQHSNQSALTIELFDHVPDGLEFEQQPQTLILNPGQWCSTQYRLRPKRRGHFVFERAEALLPSPFGLWQARRFLPAHNQTRVYPDFARLHGAQLSAVDSWLGQLGIKQRPRRGLGLEFHQLREFRDGDSLRQLDWKATARQRTPIVREYQEERDQQIILLIDCGRSMRSQDGELAHFDHALNAALLLAYVALRQGDAVGLQTFATDQMRFIAPAKGQSQLNHLLNALYDLEPSLQPADYALAFNRVLNVQKRRALVILISNLRDESPDELLPASQRIEQRHRLLIASLREEVLDQLRQTPVQNLDQALSYCGAVDYLHSRNQLHEQLLAHEVPLLDVRPRELGPELVSQYLAWKKAGVL